MNAVDPASPSGLGLSSGYPSEDSPAALPSRLSSNHLVFCGSRLVLVSRKRGKELEFGVAAENPQFPEYLSLFKILLTRDVQPWMLVRVERINGEAGGVSPYSEPLIDFGFLKDYRALVLRV